MNQRKALYYPTIITPLPWLKWAVLYWDKVSSIVPEQWGRKPTISSPTDKRVYDAMNQLKAEGIFEPTSPRVPSEKREAAEEIWKYRKLGIAKHRTLAKHGIVKDKTWAKDYLYRIHVEKFNLAMLQIFQKSGLAIMDKSYEWVFVEKNTYFLYMAVLAKKLADIDPDSTVTSTDEAEYERLAFETTVSKKGFPSLTINFKDILPSPMLETPIEDIVKFRKEKHNELLSFREIIDCFQRDISKSTSYEEIKEITVQHKEKIEHERARLTESLKESKISSFFSTAQTLIDIKSPSLWETITLTIGSNAANIPSWISALIISGTATIQIGSVVLEKRSENAAKIRESPYSYLYLAEKDKIIPKQS
jgi:hypothetical protein